MVDEPTKAPADGTDNKPEEIDGSDETTQRGKNSAAQGTGPDLYGALPVTNVVIGLIGRYYLAMRDGNVEGAANIAHHIESIRRSRPIRPEEIESLKRFDEMRRDERRRGT